MITEEVTLLPLSYHLLATLGFSLVLCTQKFSGFQLQPPVAHKLQANVFSYFQDRLLKNLHCNVYNGV